MKKSALLFVLSVLSGASYAGPLESMLPGTWYEVPNSHMSAADPCPANNCSYTANEGQSGETDDWSGGAFATRFGTQGGLIVWGGGHKGYYGNEVYVFDVGQLKWNRVTEPVVNPTCNYSTSELQDGSPCAVHTYDFIDYHPGTNSFVKLGSNSDQDIAGGGTGNVHLLSFDTLKWRRGTEKPGTFITQTGAASAYDPTRDAFWVVPAYNQTMGMYDPDANSGAGKWTMYEPYNVEAGLVASIDPIHDVMVMIDGNGTKKLVGFNLKNPLERVLLNTTGDTAPQSVGSAGFEWDPVEKGFVAWIGGTDVYTLTPPSSGDWRTASWVWTRRPAAGSNTVTPTAPNGNGTFGRFQYVPALNVYVVVNRTDENVYFYRLSPAPIRPAQPTSLTAQ